ncbi:MAG TPA: hypothetical protein VFA40_13355 [Terriglobales bacterium]|jgi:hypothetical protein|nr:hypothetical protein [Terriglobales bacterium]
MLFTVDSAKQFLLAKVKNQAERNDVPVDDIEERMFLFSETSGTADLAANEKFDASYDADAYEAKMTKLVREAYQHDKRNADRKQEWVEALRALRTEVFYGLVMVDQADIPREANNPLLGTSLWASVMEMLPFAVTELAVIGICWFVVFRPWGIMVRLPDWSRLILFVLFVALFWYVGKVFGQVGTSTRNSGKNS